MKTTTLTDNHYQQVNDLWNREYPVTLQNRFQKLLDDGENFNHYLILNEQEHVIAWAADFENNQQIRFSIIVSHAHQGQGLGSMLLHEIQKVHHEFYGWVIDHHNDVKADGHKYFSPVEFYRKHGFKILPEKRIDTDMIKAVLMIWTRHQ